MLNLFYHDPRVLARPILPTHAETNAPHPLPRLQKRGFRPPGFHDPFEVDASGGQYPTWEASHHPDSYPHQGDITVEGYNHHHADTSFHQRPTTESERRDQITNWLMDDDDSKPWPSSHDSHASGGHTQYPHEDPSLVEPTPAYHDWNRLRHNPTTEEISRLPIDVDHFSPHDHMSTHPQDYHGQQATFNQYSQPHQSTHPDYYGSMNEHHHYPEQGFNSNDQGTTDSPVYSDPNRWW